jgi:hypothetical protein
MTLAEKLVEEWENKQKKRIYRSISYQSKSNPELSYKTEILYGGTMESPNVSCECPKFKMSVNHWCRHTDLLWSSMDGWSRSAAVHHDEMQKIFEKK